MNRLLILSLLCVSLSCSVDVPQVQGKWYTYAESGDYMELWIGEDKALSYLSSIDEFLLYDVKQEGSRIAFSLIESRVIDNHAFDLEVTKQSDKILQTIFISETKVDSLKTYFLISKEVPMLKGTLEQNRENMEELFARLEGSHDGHGH